MFPDGSCAKTCQLTGEEPVASVVWTLDKEADQSGIPHLSLVWWASKFIGLACRARCWVAFRSRSDPKAVGPPKVSSQLRWQHLHSYDGGVPVSVNLPHSVSSVTSHAVRVESHTVSCLGGIGRSGWVEWRFEHLPYPSLLQGNINNPDVQAVTADLS